MASSRIAARSGRSIVVLDADDVWAFEARERLCFVHTAKGRLEVDSSLAEMGRELGPSFLRVHRRWLVHLANVRVFEWRRRDHWLRIGRGVGEAEPGIRVPVARELASVVRARLLVGTVGYPVRMPGFATALPVHPE